MSSLICRHTVNELQAEGVFSTPIFFTQPLRLNLIQKPNNDAETPRHKRMYKKNKAGQGREREIRLWAGGKGVAWCHRHQLVEKRRQWHCHRRRGCSC